MKNPLKVLVAGAVALTAFLAAPVVVHATDHADGPTVANDQGADLADLYAFQDPADNNKTVLIVTFRGFITPGQAVNLTVFDPGVRFRFAIENTGDAVADKYIDITFGPKVSADAQDVFFQITGLKTALKGKTTLSDLTVTPTPNIASLALPAGTVELFAGEADDPFFFDVPAFTRFASSKDGTKFSRARDTFAGYNVLAIALRLPKTLLLSASNDTQEIGVAVFTQRRATELVTAKGERKGVGAFRTVDRVGFPGVSTILLPLNLRNAYNASNPAKDPNKNPNKPSAFTEAIKTTLEAFGTNPENIDFFKENVIDNGDYLRLNTSTANQGTAAFPNGRRLSEDVIDSILTKINKNTPLGDNVNSNDVPFRQSFPYLAPPHMPRDTAAGSEDNTRN